MTAATRLQLKSRRARTGDAARDRIAGGPQVSRSRYAWGELPLVRLDDAHGPIINVALPGPPPLDYSRQNLLHLARTHEIVNACLRIRADRLVDPVLVVERTTDGENWEAERDHPLLSLARVPGDSLDTATFWRYLSICWDAVGAVYLEPIKSGGLLVGVNPLDPQYVTDVYSATGVLDTIEWYPGYGERVIFQPNQLIVRRRPLDIDPAPLMAALRAVDQDIAFAEYIRSFFQNSAIPSGILRFHGDASQEVADAQREKWLARFGGAGAMQNGPAVLDDMMEYQEVGSKLGDLDNDVLRKEIESRIAMPFQVPPLIIYSYLGVTTATYSNLTEAWRSFWDSPVLPLLREWGDWLTRAILPFYEDPRDIYAGMVRARFDTGTIPALQEDTGPKVAMFLEAYKQGVVSVNEYRGVLGLGGEDDPAADEIAAIKPAPEPAPPQLQASDLTAALTETLPAIAGPPPPGDMPPEGKASPSVLERHVAQYIEGEYAKARRLALSSDDVDAAIAGLDKELDDGLQLTAILAPSIRASVARSYGAAANVKVALPRAATFATGRIIETLQKRAAKIAETTKAEITAAMRAGLDLVTAGRDRASTRAPVIVTTETAAAETAGTLAGYDSRGVKSVRWTASADACPDCQALDGTDHPIEGAPGLPLHPGCKCEFVEVSA